jgi:acyl-CoA thioesterase I
MIADKFTRRRFIEKSLYLSSLTLTFDNLRSFATGGENLKRSFPPVCETSQGVPDLERIAGFLKAKDPLIWLFTGDSITQGAKHTQGYRSYPEIFSERIRWELGRARDIVINTGISGNTAQVILNDFDWRIGQFKPAVVSLMIGTNDCAQIKNITPEDFGKNLDYLLNMIREIKSVPVFHTPNTIIKEKAPERARMDEFVNVLRTICEKKQVILVDNYAWWQNEIKNLGEAAVFRKWLNDPLHPNGAGHSEIARLMFRKLSIFDPQAPSCGGPYYEGEH